MNPKIAVGVLALTVAAVLTPVQGKTVDLTKRAMEYIQRLNQTMQNITTWSLTQDDVISATNDRDIIKHGIKANVEAATCTPNLKDYEDIHPNVEKISFWVTIINPLHTPFNIFTNITILQLSKQQVKKTNVTFCISSRTRFPLGNGWKKKLHDTEGIIMGTEVCQLSAKVVLKGFFVFETMSADGNETKLHTVKIEELQDESIGLKQHGDTLEYVFHGRLVRRMFIRRSTTFRQSLLW
uniref:Uncharacterized protein n=1 Tax=Amblyomma americanum TaxID=6943 RepID=A0A0C9S5F2_AMBAM